MINQSLIKFICSNSYLSSAVYSFAFKKNIKIIENQLSLMKDFDFLDNIIPLRKFVKKIIEENSITSSRNNLYENYSMYGIWESLFGKYCSNHKIASPAIEHGLMLHNDINSDIKKTGKLACATFGDFRKNIIQSKLNIPVFCVGSYIHYADSFYSEQRIHELKEKYGKTLLVFPMHCAENGGVKCNIEKLIKIINEVSKEFNTVLVNVYWYNINDPLVDALISEGYVMTSCGLRNDLNFLSRLKSYLYMSDMAVGDGVGTHIGYCETCGVRYYHINSTSSLIIPTNSFDGRDISFTQYHSGIIENAFSSNDNMLMRQAILEDYWGNNKFKKDDEILMILDIYKDLLKETKGSTRKLYFASEKLLNYYINTDERGKFKLLKEALPLQYSEWNNL